MADYEVEVLVFGVAFAGEEPGHGFLVESVENRLARQLGDTRYACVGHHFIDHHRVGDECADADFVGDFAGDECPEVRGMLHLGMMEVVDHVGVYLVHAAFDGSDDAATADYGVDGLEADAGFGERGLHKAFTPCELVHHRGETLQIGGGVRQGYVEDGFAFVVDGHFR